MKIISAVIVLLALLLPRWGLFARTRAKRSNRSLIAEPEMTPSAEESNSAKAGT